MFIGSKPKDLFPRQNKAAADFYRRQQQKKIHAQGPYLVQRSFRRNEGTTDYATIPEVTLAGDFVIEFDFLSSDDPLLGQKTLISGSEVGSSNITVDIKDNELRFFCYNSSGTLQQIASAVGVFYDGKIYRVGVSLSGTTANISINGISVASAVWSSFDSANVSQLHRTANNTNHLSGILANLKIWDNGTLIRDYPLDDNSDILRNRAAALGPELLNSSNWTDGSTGSATATIDVNGEFTLTRIDVSNVGRLDQIITTEVGKQYMFTVTRTSADNFAMRVGTSLGGADIADKNLVLSAPQASTVVFTATTATTYINFRSTTNNGTSTGRMASIRQADGYGTVINGNASDWGLFQQQATGEWLGQELWDNSASIFFGSQEQSTIDNGSYTVATTGNGTGIQNGSITQLAGRDYFVSLNVTDISSGNINYSDFTSNIAQSLGVNSFTVSPTADRTIYIKRQAAELTSVSFDSVSIKEVLNVA